VIVSGQQRQFARLLRPGMPRGLWHNPKRVTPLLHFDATTSLGGLVWAQGKMAPHQMRQSTLFDRRPAYCADTADLPRQRSGWLGQCVSPTRQLAGALQHFPSHSASPISGLTPTTREPSVEIANGWASSLLLTADGRVRD
jgi:hypothetical protein